MAASRIDTSFYEGKRVFITGHTGFKGTWLAKILCDAGAQVTGYALEPPTSPSLFDIIGMGQGKAGCKGSVRSVIGDIRDFDALHDAFEAADPQIVLHLAAQPLVRESYRRPAYTYETNVMGTVNILECVRLSDDVESFLNVTTDKVYLNPDDPNHAFSEDEKLDGYDPYSSSKSCSELVTHSYSKSFLSENGVAVSTARAGNVIGGGDFADDRIIPDCVRAVCSNKPIVVRNPYSTRPYQHVLEPLFAYLMIAHRQIEDRSLAGSYNVGPDEDDCVPTGRLVEMFCDAWNSSAGDGSASWEAHPDGGPHEAGFLKLDCTKLKQTFDWAPRWHIDEAIAKTVEWTRAWIAGDDVAACMSHQIEAYTLGE